MMIRSILVLALVGLVALPHANGAITSNDAELGRGTLGLLRGLEEEAHAKTKLLYRYFGNNLEPSKVGSGSKCDLNDPSTHRFCNPALVGPNAGTSNPNLPSGASVKKDDGRRLDASILLENENSLPADCLDDPDNPACKKLRDLTGETTLPGIKQGGGKGGGKSTGTSGTSGTEEAAALPLFTSTKCNVGSLWSFKCGTSVFTCNFPSSSDGSDICQSQNGVIVEGDMNGDSKLCDSMISGIIADPYMMKGEIKCPNKNAISNWVCYDYPNIKVNTGKVGDIEANCFSSTPAPTRGADASAWTTASPTAPIGAIASQSPTRYMCYGNHARTKDLGGEGREMSNVPGKWCESEMPSVSLEPSESPTSIMDRKQIGGSVPGGTPVPGTPDMTSAPTESGAIIGGTPHVDGAIEGVETVSPTIGDIIIDGQTSSPSGIIGIYGETAAPSSGSIEGQTASPSGTFDGSTSAPSSGVEGQTASPSGTLDGSTLVPTSGVMQGSEPPVVKPDAEPSFAPTTFYVGGDVYSGNGIPVETEEPTSSPSGAPSKPPTSGSTVTPGTPSASPTGGPAETQTVPPEGSSAPVATVTPGTPSSTPTGGPAETQTVPPEGSSPPVATVTPGTPSSTPTGGPVENQTVPPEGSTAPVATVTPGTPSSTPTGGPAETPSVPPEGSSAPVATVTPGTPSSTPTGGPVETQTVPPEGSSAPVATVTPGTPSSTPTGGPAETPSVPPEGSSAPVATMTPGTPSSTPTGGPVDTPTTASPTSNPTGFPTTNSPTEEPTVSPSDLPTTSPSASPSSSPSSAPSASPSSAPSSSPSGSPSSTPSATPSSSPSGTPSASPSGSPSSAPSSSPSGTPSASPSSTPSSSPSENPSGSFYPSSAPSDTPTLSAEPSASPSSAPSASPSSSPSSTPSASPSSSPSSSPSGSPSSSPSSSPSGSPSSAPSASPSATPSASPSESFVPTNCYDKYDIDAEQVIEQVGSEEPLPEDTLQIVKADDNMTITLQINQMWTSDATVNVFIHYHSPETQSSVCESQEDLKYEESFTKELICYDGWTDVGLFVYLDDEFSIEECDECHPPGSDVDNVIAYYFELPCEPICITLPPETVTTPSPTLAPVSEPTTVPSICIPTPILVSGLVEGVTETTVQITGPKIQTIDFDVVQTWIQKGNLDEFAIQYLNTELVDVCEQFTDIAFEHKESFTAACVDNITSITLFIYVGDDFNTVECNACTAPEGSEDYETFVFELPCVPECVPVIPTESPESPTTTPTICIPQPDLVNTTGSAEDITEKTVQITGPNIGTIDFDVVQTWIQEGNLDEFAIQYLNTDFVDVCEQFTDIEFEHKESFTAACVDNITSITLFIYVGDEFNIDECNACTAPEGSADYETYVFELPCVPECVPAFPTDSPTSSPNSPTSSPTICIPEPDLVSTTGSAEDITEKTVQITGPNIDTIDFDVVQTWIQEGNLDEFAIRYLNTDYIEVCEQFTDISYEHKQTFTAACVENITSISLYIYVGDDFNIDECHACTVPIEGSEDYEAYVFELPCVPDCPTSAPVPAIQTDPPTSADIVDVGAMDNVDPVVPKAADCFSGIKLLEPEKDMWCNANETVLAIEKQLVVDGSSVQFTVKNVFSRSANFELRYDMEAGNQCQDLLVLNKGSVYKDVLTAKCNPITNTAVIQLFVDNNRQSHAANGKQCHDQGHNTCHIIYEIPCMPDTMCTDARKLSEDTTTHGAVTAEMSEVGNSNEVEDDAPYCVNKDFPCEGEEENMVYVCHYSNRAGYQTFCIPEADSDMMRFYSNDYCGPCEGWNGISHASQF